MRPGTSYALVDPQVLSRCYPDGAVVYIPASGDTHRLGLEALGLVEALRREPLMREKLENIWRAETGGSEGFEALLARLEQAKLIERR